MEFVAWFTHKYIMHGFLWFLHKDHHTGSQGFFERNDVFALIFAIPSWLFIMLGVINNSVASIIIGAGMTAYGLAYFTVHDVFTHQRLKWLRNSTNPYLMAVRRAHKMHHKHLERQKGESFGFLIVPRKYFKKSNDSPF
jgi:beta-carotene 3-hydroxylase